MTEEPMIHRPLRRRSKRMTAKMADEARVLVGRGYTQQEAAAFLEVNQGRISEAITGKRTFPDDNPQPPLPGLG